MRPTLCNLCKLTSEYLYSASVDWCPVAVEVHYVHSWSAFVSGISAERTQVSMPQHHFCMWAIAWERVMSGVTGLKSIFQIQTKMLDRKNHIKWGWQVPQNPSPSPYWWRGRLSHHLNYLHLKTYQKHCPALQWCPFWRIHIRACDSPSYHCEPTAWTVPWLGRKLPDPEPDLSQISTTQYSYWICCSGHELWLYIIDLYQIFSRNSGKVALALPWV